VAVRGVNVFTETEREFATGDRIQFTAPNKDLEVANRDLGTVTEIKDGQMTVKIDGKTERSITFDTAKFRQFAGLDRWPRARQHRYLFQPQPHQ
jgi:ATP-dependent exoDNAse (exonuclease V) alpha subunit